MQVDICMLLDKPADNDSRVLREAQALQDEGWHILILSYSSQHSQKQLRKINSIDVLEVPIPSHILNQILDMVFKAISYFLVVVSFIFREKAPDWFLWSFLRTTRLWTSKYRTGIEALHDVSATFIHAHDYLTLPVPFATFNAPSVIYDSHELYFEQYQPKLPTIVMLLTERKRKIETHLEEKFTHQCLAIINVSEKNAEYMTSYLHLNKVHVLRNLVDSPTSTPAIDYETAGKITIVHVGNLNAGRQLDVLITAFQYLSNDFALVLMGNGSLKEQLKQLTQSLGLESKVKFFDSVAPNDVAKTLAQADISAVINPHDGLNREYTYPQKLFESIAAGLPLITTDTVSILKLVKQYDLGLIVDPTDAKAIAKAIEKMAEPETYAHYKGKVNIARQTLNWQQEKQRLISLYDSLREKV
jgi:glycosyltransferase involved in cell wall biosynthesis